MLWMMGNEVYDIVTMKMKCNWRYDLTVSFIETSKLAKLEIKAADNSTFLH